MKRLYAVSILTLSVMAMLATFSSAAEQEPPRFWPLQCVDTMKYSRDAAAEWGSRKDLDQLVETQVAKVASLGASCVSIGTPYHEQFIGVTRAWVDAARKHHLSVWFRGNTPQWEGWFGFSRYTDPNQHHTDVALYIEKYPDLFEAGDVFTPAPEAENGALGSPWRTFEAREQYRAFVAESYRSCKVAFQKAKKAVRCGYFGVNGDVAREVYTPELVAKIGGVVAVDHYVKGAEQVVQDAVAIAAKQKSQAVLGEFGAPIQDLQGKLTEVEQAQYLRLLLDEAVRQKDKLGGMNYWVLSGGSTALLRDDGTEKPAAVVLRHYYSPGALAASLRGAAGESLPEVRALVTGPTSEHGVSVGSELTLTLLSGKRVVTFTAPGYKPVTQAVVVNNGQHTAVVVTLEREEQSLWYRFRKLLLRRADKSRE